MKIPFSSPPKDTKISMLKSLSFKQKVFFSQILLFFLFILVLFPFAQGLVSQMMRRGLEETASDLIVHLKEEKTQQGMVDYLKTQELFVFYRVSLIDDQYHLIYDTHVPHHLGEKFEENFFSPHSEVVEALKNGKGYTVGWSEFFKKDFAYVAVRFDFHGRLYILRTAFPFAQLQVWIRNFEIAFFTLDLFFLLLFGFSTWVLFSRLARPIHKIIEAIKPYQEGVVEAIPEIHLDKETGDDFNHLAHTLNSLSEKVRSQIRSVVEERNEKEAILESLVEGVIAVDGAGLVRYINFTGTQMLEMSRQQLLGKPFPNRKGKERLVHQCHRLLRMAQMKQEVATESLTIGEGQKVHLDLIAVPKPQQSGAILVIQDKSSQHQVVEMGKDFVANASHELRTPITVIRGFAETLQDIPDLSPEKLADITEKIVRNCQRMDTLVKNLLTLADLENVSETRFQGCDLVTLLERCRQSLLSIFPEATMEVQTDKGEVIVPADLDLLELALMNLLNNAVKYSHPPAAITVVLRESSNDVKIEITDRGIGIPAEDVGYIFNRFYTVNKAHSRSLGGAGIGLSIVKTIVEKHEGTITVSSVVGKGSTFTLTLPRTRHLQT